MTLLMDLVYGVGHGKEGCEEEGGGEAGVIDEGIYSLPSHSTALT